ncbi:hypothetical protein [Aliarcobacter butzleri]|uniref:hypothetical protein n=1 Tax=Aliarcobacter butzleri TaxID=28197 RepID=UPI001EDD1184|nr:hypothetical protein [Aliarcobacter butzleri]MCG3694128.1 hypothetical protein [Aliarcobacter butzleri]
MNTYEKTLQSLCEIKSVSSHLKSLGKIKVETEDTLLKQKLDNVIKELQAVYTNSNNKNKSLPISLEKGKSSAFQELIKYTKQLIGYKKPEWQILAERNGWQPSKI